MTYTPYGERTPLTPCCYSSVPSPDCLRCVHEANGRKDAEIAALKADRSEMLALLERLQPFVFYNPYAEAIAADLAALLERLKGVE